MRVDGPAVATQSCSEPAPVAVTDALREGLPLRWRELYRLFPDIEPERALIRRAVVRSASVGVCGGRVVVEDLVVRLEGPRGAPVEVVVATKLRAGVLGVTEADVLVAPAPGELRVTARDAFTARGPWQIGAVR